MGETQPVAIPIRAQLMPDYYPDFHCIGGKCRDSCCRDWRISLNKNDYMALRKLCRDGDLKERFTGGVRRARGENATDSQYAVFSLKDRNCPFLNGQGLCALQLECGEGALPKVCRTFPRSTVDTPYGLDERCCTTGCEAVLHLLYARRDGLGFLMEDIPPEEQNRFALQPKENLCAGSEAVRELCIDILQARKLPLPRRMLLLGWVLRDLTEITPADLGQWVGRKRMLIGAEEMHTALEELKGDTDLFVIHQLTQLTRRTNLSMEMERLRSKIFAYLQVDDNGDIQVQTSVARYREAEAKLQENYGDLEFFFENILVNAFFYLRYPIEGGIHDVWKNYINLCDFSGSLRFFAACGCYDHRDMGELFHVLVLACRNNLHASKWREECIQTLVDAGSTTLADMAVLVCG